MLDPMSHGTAEMGRIDTPLRLESEYTVPLATDVVQAWIDDATANRGFVIVGAPGFDDGFTIVSSEGPDGRRPRLRVTF
jgi:hypothetical protein